MSSNKVLKGKRLSKEQQEYFKDSKVRDENGNLRIWCRGAIVGFTTETIK